MGKSVLYCKEKDMEEIVMSIDVLQNRIRKLKNPAALLLSPTPDQIPPERTVEAHCRALLTALRELVGVVRVDPMAFLLLPGGLEGLNAVMKLARELGYYVILDWTRLESPAQAKVSSELLLKGGDWDCDAVVLNSYTGTDTLKVWFKAAGKQKSLFAVVKTANKSGTELQDLQTGGRFAYTAAADLVSRMGETAVERCGYSRLGAMAGAYNAASLRTLREKYPQLFLLVDGLDEPGCNAKNASYAFDRLGHGAVVCAGRSIVAAWAEAEEGTDPTAAAVEAAERMKRNLNRYVTVL